jgi:hypothetical protein
MARNPDASNRSGPVVAVLMSLQMTVQIGQPIPFKLVLDGGLMSYLSSNFCEGSAHVMRSLVKKPAAHSPKCPVARVLVQVRAFAPTL